MDADARATLITELEERADTLLARMAGPEKLIQAQRTTIAAAAYVFLEIAAALQAPIRPGEAERRAQDSYSRLLARHPEKFDADYEPQRMGAENADPGEHEPV